MIIVQFIELLAVHWFGDFVLQSRWMGVNKSKYNSVLAIHVAIYTTTLVLGTGIIFKISGSSLYPTTFWTFIAINGVLHFCTDYVTSRITSKLYAAKEYYWFFVIIGLDQLIHQVTLAVTLVWLLT